MMKFIKIDFPLELFLPANERNSFYDDVKPSETFESKGFFQPPDVPGRKPAGSRPQRV